MLKKLLLGLGVLIALLVVVVATRPAAFRIERSTQIDAPADVVFAQVNDFKRWDAWSPWAKLDPSMTTTIDGAAQGVGATYAWSGNSQVGEGRMTITESRPNEKIGVRLQFIKPWQATNTATFRFDSLGQATKVTWVMEGTNNFIGKAVGLFMDMDAMIGKEFDKGLAQMKSVSEAAHHERVTMDRGETAMTVGRVVAPVQWLGSEPATRRRHGDTIRDGGQSQGGRRGALGGPLRHARRSVRDPVDGQLRRGGLILQSDSTDRPALPRPSNARWACAR